MKIDTSRMPYMTRFVVLPEAANDADATDVSATEPASEPEQTEKKT